MTKILVFDTETTGLPERKHASFVKQKEHERSLLKDISLWSNSIEKYPSIIQLAYILYDTDNPSDSKIYNKYIDIPETIQISEESHKIHHISKEKIKSMDTFSKAYIKDSLKEFMRDFAEADVVVGHNVDFDRRMIIAEFLRLFAVSDADTDANSDADSDANITHIMELMKDENFECTQEITTPICNLKSKFEYIDPKTKIPKYIYKIKSAKLIEAYRHYFGYTPDGEHMHDAIIDVVVCLRVYGMSFPGEQAFDVCDTNSKIRELILKVSPLNPQTCEHTKHYLAQHRGFVVPGTFQVDDKSKHASATEKHASASKTKSASEKSHETHASASKTKSNEKSNKSNNEEDI